MFWGELTQTRDGILSQYRNPATSSRRRVVLYMTPHTVKIFLQRKGEEPTFIGDYEVINTMNEANDLPVDLLAKHPEIQTFDHVFGGAVQT